MSGEPTLLRHRPEMAEPVTPVIATPAPPEPATGRNVENPLEAVVRATRVQRWALIGGLLVAGWLGLQLFASVLLPFVLAAGIAYILDPPASRLTRAGVPRTAASLTLIVTMLAGGLLFALLLYPLILAQLGLLLTRLPGYVEELRIWLRDAITHLQDRLGPEFADDRLRDLVAGQAGSMLSFLTGTISRVIGSGFAIFNVLSLLVVTPVVAFYLLRDWPRVLARIDSWLPRRYVGVLRAQASEVNRILAAWVRGQALCCIALALFYAFGLTLVGLDLGLIVGLSAGLLSVIPYVGSITGAACALGLAVAQFATWGHVAEVGAVFIVGQILEAYVIYPRFLGDRVELHAVWVIFALFAGAAAFGFLGVLLAVPVTATLGVLARFWLRRYLRSPLYLEPPTGRPPAGQ